MFDVLCPIGKIALPKPDIEIIYRTGSEQLQSHFQSKVSVQFNDDWKDLSLRNLGIEVLVLIPIYVTNHVISAR